MSVSVTTTQREAVEPGVSVCALPETALRAVRRARALEREVALFRATLAGMSEQERQNPVWKEQLAQLLSRVVLFRVALADTPQRSPWVDRVTVFLEKF